MKNIIIIGAGLIGGSIAKAQLKANPDAIINAIDSNSQSLEVLQQDGIITSGFAEICANSLRDADIIIIATPPQQWAEIASKIKDLYVNNMINPQLIMDVGSVKQYALECFGELPNFIATHPIAGSEFSGAAFSTAELFQNKRVILTTSNDENNQQLIDFATAFWQNIGANCTIMEATQHDLIYAYVSHLPQLIAFAMAEAFLPHLRAQNLPAQTHNFYRLCGSSPTLWHGIFQHNSQLPDAIETLLRLLEHMIGELQTGSLESSTEGSAPNMEMGLLLTPRIIASIIISSANLSEKKYGMSMARYAGSGFASLTHPAMTDPAEDLALISEHSGDVIFCLKLFEHNLRHLMNNIKQQNWQFLETQLNSANAAYQQFIMEDEDE